MRGNETEGEVEEEGATTTKSMVKMRLIFTVVVLFVSTCFTEVCRDNSAYLCKQADCRQDVFKRKCCKTCQGPNPPTYAPQTPIYTRTPKTCGKPIISPNYITGERNAVIGSWPWQVMLFYNNRRVCGGTIISPYHIVTAAHCVQGTNANKYLARVAADDSSNTFVVDHEVKNVVPHFDFNKFSLDKDIALLQLKTPIQYNSYVQPVCLPLNYVKMDAHCVVVGWRHSNLQQSKIQLVINTVCHDRNKRFSKSTVTKNMLCGGNPEEGEATCHGNAGGGLVCRGKDSRWQLQGIVSSHCNSKFMYTTFTRVSEFRSWLESNKQ